MEENAAVQVENLHHSYGSRRALAGVSFDVPKGEIFGLLGPNGGGKTTLFRILSTAFPPTSGTARIFGLDVRDKPDSVRQRIGVVFQNPSLDKKLTVTENIRYHGNLYGLRGKDLQARMNEMLDRLAIGDRKSSVVETLSGGLQRRVELAKGLLHRPELLILDEPSVGLDPGARRDLWLYLQRLRDKDGVTILLTTHLIDEADRCDRVLILHHGLVVAIGTPDALKEQIGGDVITFSSKEPERLRLELAAKFKIQPAVLNGKVRIEKENGHALVSQSIEAFADLIDSVNLSKPTLEDVFIARTGHRFWEDERE
ncbi:MAG: ABC transporter ATP-binding protein [Acidobacteria bacterium]|nr:ABC transporter ATP-binding protein [Acidobacteriota bacterium]